MALFLFRGAKSHASTFCDPAIVKSLICEERENDAFPFPHDINGLRKVQAELFATLSIVGQPKYRVR
jgi:hypothetical protein